MKDGETYMAGWTSCRGCQFGVAISGCGRERAFACEAIGGYGAARADCDGCSDVISKKDAEEEIEE